MTGLPASGKSTIAARLRSELGAVLLDKDEVRAFLFADHVDYEREQDDLCVNIMYDVACHHFKRRPDSTVILDGRTYSRRYQIDAVKQAATRASVPLYLIECVCTAESARKRLESNPGSHLAEDRNYLMYQNSKAHAEPIDEPRLVLDTDAMSEDQCVRAALNYLGVF